MFPALLATFFFALSAVCGQRLTRLMGGVTANFSRLLLAFVILAALTAACFADSIRAETAGWYLLSGAVGFGVGDVALFLAYPHLGSRLTVLVLMCFACLFGAAGDRLFLNISLRWEMAVSIAVILFGLVLALHRAREPLRWNRGLVFAVIAGWGQGAGAVLSRFAQEAAHQGGFEVHALSQTAQRALGGLFVSGLALAIVVAAKRRHGMVPPAGKRKHFTFWLVGSALCGPVVGVSAMQWALEVLKSSSLVIAITATAPLVIIPLARWIEKETPSPRAVLGTVVAVVGVAMAALAKDGRW